jgi:hypothetical protein
MRPAWMRIDLKRPERWGAAKSQPPAAKASSRRRRVQLKRSAKASSRRRRVQLKRSAGVEMTPGMSIRTTKMKHHEGEEQAGPADKDFGGDAEGCGDECDAYKVGPEESKGHVGGDEIADEVDTPEMECAEYCHGGGERKVGEGDDLVEAVGAG